MLKLSIILAFCLSVGPFLPSSVPEFNMHSYNGESSLKGIENNMEIYLPQDSIFQNDSEVFFYAYMDLNVADESLKEKILQARNIIISNSSWVADEIEGCVKDIDGNIIEELPHFSEIFPDDWEPPIHSAPNSGFSNPQNLSGD